MWEYYILKSSFKDGLDEIPLEEKLDEAGEEGWEAVSAFPIASRGDTVQIWVVLRRGKRK